jgi:hypothetical protein
MVSRTMNWRLLRDRGICTKTASESELGLVSKRVAGRMSYQSGCQLPPSLRFTKLKNDFLCAQRVFWDSMSKRVSIKILLKSAPWGYVPLCQIYLFLDQMPPLRARCRVWSRTGRLLSAATLLFVGGVDIASSHHGHEVNFQPCMHHRLDQKRFGGPPVHTS